MGLSFARLDRASASIRHRHPRLFRIYVEICLCIDTAGQHAGAYTGSTKALARALRLDPAQVRRGIKRLDGMGLVSIENAEGGHGPPPSPPPRPPDVSPLLQI